MLLSFLWIQGFEGASLMRSEIGLYIQKKQTFAVRGAFNT